jgi:hypothetical protein
LQRNKTSVSREDYLKAIWEMLEENQVPISARLAEELDVTPPAVTAALKRMARDGHVKVQRVDVFCSPPRDAKLPSISRFATNSPKCFSPKSLAYLGPKRMPKPNAWSTPSPPKSKLSS